MTATAEVEVVVVGAGQASLSAAHFLGRRGFDAAEFVVLDANDRPGDAWQHRWSVAADVILWATGFRHALDHLAPLGLRTAAGGIRMDGTHVPGDPRIHLLGHGPSASTIGANRAGRAAVRDIRRLLERH